MNSHTERLDDRVRQATLVLAGLFAAGAVAAAEPLDCLLQPNQVVQLGTATAGVIEAIGVERGDVVRRGQAVARLSADVERASLLLSQNKAGQSADTQAAERSREFARRELDRANGLVARNFLSKAAVDKAETESQVSQDRLQQALERRKQSEYEARLAEAQLARKVVRASISGIVTDRYLSVGEYVEDKPILRIAETNPLRVEVVVPAHAFGLITAGTKAMVRPEVGGVREAAGTVTVVDRVIEPASNTFRVRLALPNPDLKIPAGARCKIDFGFDLKINGPSAATSATATPVSAAGLQTGSTARSASPLAMKPTATGAAVTR
jgi:RND family efflux transporter MFP subunit